MVSTQSSGIISSLPSDVAQEALRRVTNLETQSRAQDQGLARIWRMLFLLPRRVCNTVLILIYCSIVPLLAPRRTLSIIWEAARIGHSCGVDLSLIEDLTYNSEWVEQADLRASLARHQAFQGKAFPAASSDTAWAAGLRAAGLQQCAVPLPFDQDVVYTASLDFVSNGRRLQLTMQPLKLEQSHRLARHFGADRFLELLVPSPDSVNIPASLKGHASFFQETSKLVGKIAFLLWPIVESLLHQKRRISQTG